MLKNIFQALETLGLNAQKRAIHAQFSNSSLNDQVFLQYVEGTHQLNQGIELQLLCLSTSAVIPLKVLLAVRLPLIL